MIAMLMYSIGPLMLRFRWNPEIVLPKGFFFAWDWCDGPIIPIWWFGLFHVADHDKDGCGGSKRWFFGWNRD